MNHLGGQAAVVVPVTDFLRLRALEQAATPPELEDAEGIQAVRDAIAVRHIARGTAS